MKQILFAFFLCVGLNEGFAQTTVPNAGFESVSDPDGAAAGWHTEGAFDRCYTDAVRPANGSRSMHLSRSAPSGMGNFYQQLPFTSTGLKKYRISCLVRTAHMNGRAGVGARVFDKNGNTITGYNAINVLADQDWTAMSGEFYSDAAAASVRLFCNLAGAGEVWFDDLRLEEIPLSPAAAGSRTRAYVAEYFALIRKYGIVKDSAFLSGLQEATLRLCAGDTSRAYCHNILKRYTSLKLNDGHSFFFTPAEWREYRHGSATTTQQGLVNFISGRMLNDGIAYLKVSSFASLDSGTIQRYVDSAQHLIAGLEAQHPAGWVIDLSGNGGGNAFAMIPALGPLLGDGVCGYSRSANGDKRVLSYRNGWAGWDATALFRQRSKPYHLKRPAAAIALLYDAGVGSSGEVVAVAFRGMPNTRSFGQATSGTTTRIDNLELSDGACLNLACGWAADRSGRVYRGPVPPDTAAKDWEESLTKASGWILSRNK